MNRYPSYKPSGVKWLGEIPSHWEVNKAKYLWKESFSVSENGNEELLSVSQYDGITPAKGDSRSESLQGYKIVSENDLVINIMLAWMGGLGVSKYDGIVSPAYCVYKLTNDSNPKYLHYLYKTPLYLAEFARRSSGVIPSRWRMYTDDFGQVVSLLPPRKEQDAIVEYLDEKMAKIDAAIAQQQKMIDLLNERKQIIINRAVTRGLNPNARMKDSGVEWIGEVPEGWEVKKLGYCIDILPGYAFPSQDFVENGIKLLRGINVSPEKIRWEESVYWNKTIDDTLKKYLLEVNDLVVGLDRTWIGSGTRVAIVKKEDLPCLLVQRVCRIRPTNMMSINYIYYLLSNNLFYNALAVDTTGVSVPHISTEQIKKVVVPIPELSEQNAIVEYIEMHIASINKAIRAANKQISLLQERKQIIINALVTGKVMVCKEKGK